MRTISIALLCFAVAITAAAADVHGAWTATTDTDTPGRVHLFITAGEWMQSGHSFDASTLALSPGTLHATTSTPVTLKLERDAGTLLFEGTFRNGDGAGQFTFTANRNYLEALRAMGVMNDLPEERSEPEQMLGLALMDVSLDYARAIRSVFHDITLRDLRKGRAVGVTPEFIASMRQQGIEISDMHEAARLAAVGVTVDYVRAMRAAGVHVTDAHDAVRLKAVNVTPEFVAELARAGYTNLSTRDLIRMAATGVNGKFIREMSKYKQ
ncbi:MAG TPA: hypothetical protein VF980_17525 [Thermoanaerobaculia bacterium]